MHRRDHGLCYAPGRAHRGLEGVVLERPVGVVCMLWDREQFGQRCLSSNTSAVFTTTWTLIGKTRENLLRSPTQMNADSFFGVQTRAPSSNTVRRHPNYVCSRLAPNHTWCWDNKDFDKDRTLLDSDPDPTGQDAGCGLRVCLFHQVFLTSRFSLVDRASWYITYGSR